MDSIFPVFSYCFAHVPAKGYRTGRMLNSTAPRGIGLMVL